MPGHISVEEALQKRRWMIDYPELIIGLIVMFMMIFIGVRFQLSGIIIPLISLSAMFLVIAIFRSFFDPKWRVWAFSNVVNIHELRKLAVERNILHQDGSLKKKYEFRSNEITKKLEEIECNLEGFVNPKDDSSIPAKTTIYYSRSYKAVWVPIVVFIIIFSITPSSGRNPISNPQFWLLPFATLAITIWEGRFMFNKRPPIILSDDGIETEGPGFVNWELITKEEVYKEDAKAQSWYLYYKHPAGPRKILLKIRGMEKLEVSYDRIAHLLYVYRNRFNQKQNPQANNTNEC